jgi:hypothetical protein
MSLRSRRSDRRRASGPGVVLRNVGPAIVLLGAIVACGGGGGSSSPIPTSSPVTQAAIVDVLPSPGTIYFGAFSNPTQVTPPPIASLTQFEAQIGRTVALTIHYYGFYDTFPGPYEANDLANGRIPIDSWDCQYPNAAIAAGNQDALITKRAQALKAYGHPVFLRYMWEMNLPATTSSRQSCYDPNTDAPNGVFSAAEFVAAWVHMRTIFLQQGVTNVVWLWNPSGGSDPGSYYPGASQVDWVGFDKYDDTSTSFAETYAQPYAWLAPIGKPMLVGETGVPAAIQPEFFAAAVATLQSQFPLIKGYVYFNANSWVVGGQGLAAFKAMAADPYFSGREP